MVAQSTDDILRELDRTPGGPVEFEDPRTHARYVVIPQDVYRRVRPLIEPRSSSDGETMVEWNDSKNNRRCDLIDKEIAGTLTLEEAIELDRLQHEMYEYRRCVAPLPLDDLRELHRSLLEKAAQAKRDS